MSAWPVGIVNAAAWLVLFGGAGLYTDAGLQVVYIVLGIAGWYWWLRGGADRSRLGVSRTSRGDVYGLVVAGVAGTALLTALNLAFTDTNVPLPDAATTAVSLVAQYMMTRKLVASWYVWITVDVAYIALYIYKDLYLTALLMPVFIAMCIVGLRDWRRALVDEDGARPSGSDPTERDVPGLAGRAAVRP